MYCGEENVVGVEEYDDDVGDEEGLDEVDMYFDGGGGNLGDFFVVLVVWI